MNIFKLIKKAIEHPDKIVTNLGRRGLLNWMSDETYIKLLYYAVFRKFPDLKNPRTFNEKLQWLKLHDRKPEYTKMVDKFEVKKYVADIIGEEYIIPTLGVWEKFDDIDFDSLPEQFVLKCTNDSGGVVICKDKSKFDKMAAKKKINKGLKENFFYFGREYPYKNVRPRIIAEQYMAEESGADLKDYKIFNFDGEPKLIQVDYDRFTQHKRNLYSIDWEYIDAAIQYQTDKDQIIKKPEALNEMLVLAKKLSGGITHVRTDFYCIGKKVYFGEITFYHGTGLEKFTPEQFGIEMGNWIELPGGVLIHTTNIITYIRQGTIEDITDYKFFCFHGKPMYCQVIKDRSKEETIDFFDMNWNHMGFTGLSIPNRPCHSFSIPIPICFQDMKKKAEILAGDMPFVRVDFYEVKGKLYFGEITFYPMSGFGIFMPDEWNWKMGDMICV